MHQKGLNECLLLQCPKCGRHERPHNQNPFILEDPDLNSLRGDAEIDHLVDKTTEG